MKRKLTVAVLFGLMLAASGLVAQQSKQADIDLQAAIRTETVKGDLKTAIKQYDTIVTTYSKDRAIVAQALVHMAACYQKLGDSESRNIYERVVRDYSDQKDAAELARTRLGTASSTSVGLARRRVWSGQNRMFGSVSFDGTLISESINGDLWVRNVLTGAVRQITNQRKGDPVKNPAYPALSAFSEDAKRIAVAWNIGQSYELRLINVDGSNEQTVYRNPDLEWIGPVAWSMDGRQILVQTRTKDKSGQIAWISLTEKSSRVLKTIPWSQLGGVVLSHDGRQIAYDARPTNQSKTNTVFVLASDGSKETAVTDGTTSEKVFGWTPDGRSLLFETNRRGASELWAVGLIDGKPTGTPKPIQSNMDSLSQPIGITKNGSLFYWQVTVAGEVNVASVDWNTGAVTGVKKMSSGVVPDRGADWSPDGQKVAFLAHRVGDFDNWFIAVRSVDGRESRDIAPPDGVGIRRTSGWSPDGTLYLVTGNHGGPPQSHFVVDMNSGSFKSILTPANNTTEIGQAFWMPTGKAIIYNTVEQKVPGLRLYGLFIRDVDSGIDREVTFPGHDKPVIAFSFSVSPDGRYLAFNQLPGPGGSAIKVMSLDGGDTQQVSVGGWIWGWTPDSQSIIHAANEGGLALSSVKGSDSRSLNIELLPGKVNGLGVLRNGHQIAYNKSGQEMEVWVMDNLVSSVDRLLGNK